MNKYWKIIIILTIGLFLRIYQLNSLMPFIGDYGWFYLSARDMVLTGDIPLMGITASRTWLHQGPLWTYIVGIFFYFFKFNPFIPAYFIVILSTSTIFCVYYAGKHMFNARTGEVAALIYACSPFAIMHGRMPYHTSPIPFFSILLLMVTFLWIHKNKKFFFFTPPLLALLYNFELVTLIYIFIILGLFVYGRLKKVSWIFLKNTRYWIYALLVTFLIMLPVLIYDFSHGFPQTITLAGWIPYRIVKIARSLIPGSEHTLDIYAMSEFFIWCMKFMFVLFSGLAGVAIFLISLLKILFSINIKKNTWWFSADMLILYFTAIPIVSILVNDTPSEGYIIMLFPLLAVFVARALDLSIKGFFSKVLFFSLLGLVIGLNLFLLLKNYYYVGVSPGYGARFDDRLSKAKEIIQRSGNQQFQLKGQGLGSEFRSFTMNMEYLVWYFGKSSQEEAQKTFIIYEDNGKLYVK